MKKTIFLPASTRGNSNIGWLNGYHSFNLAHFYDADRVPLGPLVVFNEDTVQPGRGFATHHHSNMEIISIPLKGAVSHRDSTGQERTIRAGDVQVMSAGTGISHSEYNSDSTRELISLQIWIVPKVRNVEPRYQEATFDRGQTDTFVQLVGPGPIDVGLWIYQDVRIYRGRFQTAFPASYELKDQNNGVYLFILSGSIKVDGYILHPKDAVSMQGISKADLDILLDSEVLLIEVPLL